MDTVQYISLHGLMADISVNTMGQWNKAEININGKTLHTQAEVIQVAIEYCSFGLISLST